MRQIQEVEIDNWPGKWPYTSDTDFSEILAQRRHSVYGDVHVTTRFYPAYCAYARVDRLSLPKGAGAINNTILPDPLILERQVADLRAMASDGCTVLRWRHAYECYPSVVEAIRPYYKTLALEFGDDCPGSSEVKTAPVAKWFDAIIYMMFIRDHATGELTADYYKRLGIPWARFVAIGRSSGIAEYVRENPVLPTPDIDLFWAGQLGSLNQERAAFLAGLGEVRGERRIVLHGSGCRDGVLHPTVHDRGRGFIVGPYYRRSLCGLNYQMSSIFNCRFWDLSIAGCPQLIWDKHGELSRFCFNPGEHYIPFDGTVEGALKAVECLQENRAMAKRCHDVASALVDAYNTHNARYALYKDHS